MTGLVLLAILVMVTIAWLCAAKAEVHYRDTLQLRTGILQDRDCLLEQEERIRSGMLLSHSVFQKDTERAAEIVKEMARIDQDFKDNNKALIQALVLSVRNKR